MTKLAFAPLVAALSLTLLAGCSSDGSDGAEDATTTTAPDGVVTGGVEKAPKLEGAKGAFDDLSVATCGTGPGKAVARGTLTNTTKEKADFVLTVSWVEPVGNRVLATDTAVFEDVPAGKAQAFEVGAEVPGKNEAECAYRVERGALA